MTPYPPPQPTQYAQPAPPPGAPPSGYYQQGQPYYPPPPVMAPVYVPPPGQKTFEGLKWVRNATMLVLVYNLMAVLGGLMAAVALASIGTVGPGNFGAALGMFALMAILLVVGVIIGFIGFILGMIGYYNVHEGRREFGPNHEANVKGSVKWFAIACVLYLVSIVASAVLSVNMMMAGALNPGSIATTLAISAAVSGSLEVVFVYAAAMTMQMILASLMTQQGRAVKNMFMILSIVGAALSLVLNVLSGFLFTSAIFNATAMGGITAFASIAAVLSVVTMFLYHKQVISAEQGARNMIQSGQFNPDPGMPSAPMAPAAPPM